MDIEAYYRMAKAWKEDDEEGRRLQAEKEAEEIKAEWKKIAQVIREQLPIEGMTLHETTLGEFNDMPCAGVFYLVDCQINPRLREAMKVPPDKGRLNTGVIRVVVGKDLEIGDHDWLIVEYRTWNNMTGWVNHERPYSAFLAVYNPEELEFTKDNV